MRPEEQDLAYLWDMRKAAKEIVAFVKGIQYAEFIQNRMIRYAVERQLLVIGEAANHVSAKFQEAHPELPWRQMILPSLKTGTKGYLLWKFKTSYHQ